MLRILGRPSSINVRKVLVVADELGLAYRHEPQWATPQAPAQSPPFLRLNPNGQVPVIEDENGALWESNTICRYLIGKARRDDLLPAEPVARARVEMWVDWQATDLNTAWRYVFPALARGQPPDPDPQLVADGARRWNAAMGIVEGQLKATGLYLAGPALTLADIVVGLSAHRWRATPLDHAELPAVAAWLARLDGRPAFARHARLDNP